MMEIAHRLAVTTGQHSAGAGGSGFSVSLTGLTDNPTFGLCAERGAPVEALATGVAGGLSYQWYLAGQGPIAGATAATFTPDASVTAEALLYCVLTGPGGVMQSSAQVVVRAVPPAPGTALNPIEVYDVDTGVQTVAAASAFVGQELQFSVTGAGATIDSVTGDVSLPTDVLRDGDWVTVTASNSGGALSSSFQVTVEDVAVTGAFPFGALTPAGMGGVPVTASTITEGDPGGHWQIVNGFLVPTAAGAGALTGVYPLVFDTAETLDILIEEDRASARPDEIEAVYNALPNTARGLMVQSGDGRGVGRIYLQPKAFVNEMVLEPTAWQAEADPRQSLRPTLLAGLAIGGSENGALRTENLTVQGFVFQMEAGGLLPPSMQNASGDEVESDGNIGIVLVEAPSRDVTIRQNEIWSRTTADIVANDDYRDNRTTSRQLRGITTRRSTAHASQINRRLTIAENHIHDVTKGIIMTNCGAESGLNSAMQGNIILDTYTGFATIGNSIGVDVFDNRGLGVFGADESSDGFVGQSGDGIHSGLFGFDASGPRACGDIFFMGNIFGSSAKVREDLEVLAGNSAQRNYGATGVKFNDPTHADTYFNIHIGFNLLVTRGLALEISGATADPGTYINVFHNTIVGNPDPQGGSNPLIYFTGAEHVRLWNNLAAAYGLGASDGSGFYVETLDTLAGYRNVQINFRGDANPAADFDEVDYFTGPLAGAEIDDYAAAYVPKPAMGAALSTPKAGALGTGLYAGGGVHSSPYVPPVVASGIGDVAPITVWDGSVHLLRTAPLAGSAPGTFGSILMAWEGEIDAAGGDMDFFSVPGSDLYLRRESTGQLRLRCERAGFGEILAAESSFKVNPADGMVRLMASYDMQSGRVQFIKNGVPDPFIDIGTMGRADGLDVDDGPFRIGADSIGGRIFTGQFGRAYFAFGNTFFDLETDAGLSAFYAADGTFRDWGADGSLPTGAVPAVYIRGPASGITNLGNGGAFTQTGGSLGP